MLIDVSRKKSLQVKILYALYILTEKSAICKISFTDHPPSGRYSVLHLSNLLTQINDANSAQCTLSCQNQASTIRLGMW